jgi:hypothetical protein
VWVGRWIGFESDLGGAIHPLKKFRNLNDIDIAPPPIDWVGNLRNRNYKKITQPEVMCWSLDFTGVERHSEGDYQCEDIAFGDIEPY